MAIHKNIKKLISLFTVACFIMTFAGQNLSWAAAGMTEQVLAEDFKKIFENIPKIPSEYGKITSFSDEMSGKIVVNIQDLHCHAQVQSNISKIIEILDKNYNVKGIFVEGAYGKIDTSWLDNIKNEKIKDFVTQQLFDDGKLGAAEYYAIKNGRSGLLFGLENEDRHKENIRRLGYILDKQDAYQETLSSVEKQINLLRARHTNSKNKRFDKTLDRYKKGKITPEKLYLLLYEYIKNIDESPEKYSNILPINISEYPNILNYMRFAGMNSKTDPEQVSSQLQSLINFLKTSLPYASYRMFLEQTGNMQNLTALSESVKNMSSAFGLDLSTDYKQLDMFFKSLEFGKSLNPVGLIEEERRLIERLRIALSYDQTEKEITFLMDFYGYFSDYLQNKLMADDFAYFAARFEKFRELYSKYTVTDNLKKIEPDFEILHAYYSLNDHRNKIFLDNITEECREKLNDKPQIRTERSETECLEAAEEIYIAVTGGYHSVGLSNLLKEKGLTSIVITPAVTTEAEKARHIYEEVVRQQNIFLREALAFTIASQVSSREQFDLMVSAGISYINDAGYSRAAIDALADAVKDFFGDENSVVNVNYKETETHIVLADGTSVTIQNNKGAVSLKKSSFEKSEEKPFLNFAAVKNAVSGLTATLSSYTGIFNPYMLLKQLYQTAYDNSLYNILSDDGLAIGVEEFLKMSPDTSELDGISIDVLASMPKALQHTALSVHFADRLKELESIIMTADKNDPAYREALLSIMRLKTSFAKSDINETAKHQLEDLFGVALMFHQTYTKEDIAQLKKLLSSRNIPAVLEWLVSNTSMEMSDIEGSRNFAKRFISGKENLTTEGVYGMGAVDITSYMSGVQEYKLGEIITRKDHLRNMADAFSRIFLQDDLSFFMSSAYGKKYGISAENSPDLDKETLELFKKLGNIKNIHTDMTEGFILGAVLHGYTKHIREADDASGRPDSSQYRRTSAVLAADLMENTGFDDFSIEIAKLMIQHHDAFWYLYSGQYFEKANINYVTPEGFRVEISEAVDNLLKTEKGSQIGREALTGQLLRMVASITTSDVYASGDRYISKRYFEFVDNFINAGTGEKTDSAKKTIVFEKSKFASFMSGLSEEEKDTAVKLIVSTANKNDLYVVLPENLIVYSDLKEGDIDAMLSVSPVEITKMAEKGYDSSFASMAQKMIKSLWTGSKSVSVSKKSNYFDTSKAEAFFHNLPESEKGIALRLITAAADGNPDIILAESGIYFENSISLLPDLQKNQLIKTAQKAYGNNEFYESIGRKIIDSLWVKSTSKGNEIFEKIKKAIHNDEKATICFVCSANVNRSAVPHVIMQQMLRDNNNKHFKIISSGTMTEERHKKNVGNEMNNNYTGSRELGLIVDADIVKSFTSEEFGDLHASSDFIIAAEEKHRQYIISKYKDSMPDIAERVFLFGEIIPDLNDDSSVLNMHSDHQKTRTIISLTNKFISYFFEFAERPPTETPSAILPKNIEKVRSMIANGESSLKIAFFVATFGKAGEFFSSLNPFKFIRDHKTRRGKIGAAIVSLGGYAFFGAALIAAAPALGIAAVAVAAVVGAAANIALHTVIDYTYIKRNFLRQETTTTNDEATVKEERSNASDRLKDAVRNNTPANVCFVCTANLNRSAAAHVLFEERMRKEGKTNIRVSSAGTTFFSHLHGEPLSPELNALLGGTVDQDILDSFRSDFLPQILEKETPDFIVVASEEHKSQIESQFPELKDRIILFSELSPSVLQGDMPDPQSMQISRKSLINLIDNIFYNAFTDIEDSTETELEEDAAKMNIGLKYKIKNFFSSLASVPGKTASKFGKKTKTPEEFLAFEGRTIASVIADINGDASNQNAVSKNETLINSYVERQFKTKEKGVTELISNALDAAKDNVSVDIAKNIVRIENDGKDGISLDTVFENLINTANTTKTQKAEQIGRFGLGFFSALNFLEEESDSLDIISVRNDQSFKVSIGVKFENGKRTFIIKSVRFLSRNEALKETKHFNSNGTAINIHSQSLSNSDKLQSLVDTVSSDFSHSLKPVNLFLGGALEKRLFSEKDDYDAVNGTGELQQDLSISVKKSTRKTALPGSGKMVVIIKGVKFFELPVLGANAMEEVLISLPNDLDFAISRDSITINEKLLSSIHKLIQEVETSDRTFSEKMALLSALFVLCDQFEQQQSGFIEQSKIKNTAENLIKAEIEKAGKENRTLFIVEDTLENYEFFGTENGSVGILVNPNLMKEIIYFSENTFFVTAKDDFMTDEERVLYSVKFPELYKEHEEKYKENGIKFSALHFDNATQYPADSEYSGKKIIRIGRYILINDNELSSVLSVAFENDYFETVLKSVDKEMHESKHRVKADKSPKFYSEKKQNEEAENKLPDRDTSAAIADYDVSLYGVLTGTVLNSGTVFGLMSYYLQTANKSQITNEISQTVHDLGQSDAIFIRELLKNSVESGASEISAEVNDELGILVIRDNGSGMSFEQIVNSLLIPNKIDKSAINSFGNGIFSAFNEDVLKIVIVTSHKGKTHSIELFPVRNGYGRVIDINYTVKEIQYNGRAGTEVEFHSQYQESNYLSSNLIKHLSLMHTGNVKIMYNGRNFASPLGVKPLTPVNGKNGAASIYFAEDGISVLSVDGYFVKNIGPAFIDELGVNKADPLFNRLVFLLNAGIILELPADTKLLLSKQDVLLADEDKKDIILHLENAFIKLFMQKAGSNSSVISEIPYDYLHNPRSRDEMLDNYFISGQYRLNDIRYIFFYINNVVFGNLYSCDYILKNLQKENYDKMRVFCNYIYSYVDDADAKNKAFLLFNSILETKGNNDALMEVLEKTRDEIFHLAADSMFTEREIEEYNIHAVSDAMKDNHALSFAEPMMLHERGIRKFINITEHIHFLRQENKYYIVKIEEKKHKDDEKKEPEQKTTVQKGKNSDAAPELRLMHNILKSVIDAAAEAYGYEHDIAVGFEFNTSQNMSANAGNNTINFNIATMWFLSLFREQAREADAGDVAFDLSSSDTSATGFDIDFLRHFRASVLQTNPMHSFMKYALATIFHELTHIVEKKEEDGTHNKKFYDTERDIMMAFVQNRTVMNELFVKLQKIFEEDKDTQFDTFETVVKNVWSSRAFAAYKAKERRQIYGAVTKKETKTIKTGKKDSSDLMEMILYTIKIPAFYEALRDLSLKKNNMQIEKEVIDYVELPKEDDSDPGISSDNLKLQLPAVGKLLNLLGIEKDSERAAEITAGLEAVFIMLSTFVPGFHYVFLKWHKQSPKSDETLQKRDLRKHEETERETRLTKIENTVRQAWYRGYNSAVSGLPFVRTVQKMALAVQSAVKASFEEHKKWNMEKSFSSETVDPADEKAEPYSDTDNIESHDSLYVYEKAAADTVKVKFENKNRVLHLFELDQMLESLDEAAQQEILKLLVADVSEDASILGKDISVERLFGLFDLYTGKMAQIKPESLRRILDKYENVSDRNIDAFNKIISSLWNRTGDVDFERIKKIIRNNEKTVVSFLCIGNKNRSPVAHVILEQMLRNHKKSNIQVLSAGLNAHSFENNPISKEHKDILNGFVDKDIMESFKTEQFDRKHVESDFIIVSEKNQKQYILERNPQLRGKVFVFSEFIPDTDNKLSTIDIEFDRERGFGLAQTLYSFLDYFFDEPEMKKISEEKAVNADEESPIQEKSVQIGSESPKAILPENLDNVNDMAQKGKGALYISIYIAFKELAKSMLSPRTFYKVHISSEGRKGAAMLITVSYAAMIICGLTTLLFPVMAIIAVPVGIAAGLFSNIVTHIIIDYHYSNSAGLINAVKEFGSKAKLNESGQISIPIYIINDEPAEYGSLSFINSGIKVNGSTLWIGEAENAMVVYAKNVDYQHISQEMASNKKLHDRIRKISKKDVKIALIKNNIMVDWIEVTHQDNGRDISYSGNGNIQASYALYKNMQDRGEVLDFMAALRKTRNVDAFTFAQSITHGLDDVSTLEEFQNYLRQHQKIGNGQILVTYDLVQRIGLNKFAEFLNAARKDGVQVFVETNMNETDISVSMAAQLVSAGFAGHTYIVTKEYGERVSVDIYALGTTVEAKVMDDFNTPKDLEDNLKKSTGFIIIKNSNLKKIINTERSGMYIGQLVESISSFKILKIFSEKPLTEDFARNAARNFEMQDIPSLSSKKMLEFKEILKNNTGAFGLEEFVALTRLKQSHPISVYITKIQTKTKNDDIQVINAFLEGIAERMLVADTLSKTHKSGGLKDKNLETVLGRALVKSIIHNTEGKGLTITSDLLGRSMQEAEEKMNGAVGSLMTDAFENNNPKAINSIIELIPALAESRQELKIKDGIIPAMDINHYNSILAAA